MSSTRTLSNLSTFRKWQYALKLKSWPKILVPFVLGHAIGAHLAEKVDWSVFLLSTLSVLFGVGFIVLMNDWGDRRIDAIKRRMFPDGCSPKTIPDGILPPKQLLYGGIFCGLMALVFVLWSASVSYLTPTLAWLAAACYMAFIGYTLPPFKLNYRGGGELLEMLGTGLLLPLIMAYLQAGMLPEAAHLQIFLPFALLSLSSAVASGLADEESDREGGKITFVTIFGNHFGRKTVETLVVLAFVVLLGLGAGFSPEYQLFSWQLFMPILLISSYWFYKLMNISPKAQTNAFGYQGSYKLLLHQIIWATGLYFCIPLVFS